MSLLGRSIAAFTNIGSRRAATAVRASQPASPGEPGPPPVPPPAETCAWNAVDVTFESLATPQAPPPFEIPPVPQPSPDFAVSSTPPLSAFGMQAPPPSPCETPLTPPSSPFETPPPFEEPPASENTPAVSFDGLPLGPPEPPPGFFDWPAAHEVTPQKPASAPPASTQPGPRTPVAAPASTESPLACTALHVTPPTVRPSLSIPPIAPSETHSRAVRGTLSFCDIEVPRSAVAPRSLGGTAERSIVASAPPGPGALSVGALGSSHPRAAEPPTLSRSPLAALVPAATALPEPSTPAPPAAAPVTTLAIPAAPPASSSETTQQIEYLLTAFGKAFEAVHARQGRDVLHVVLTAEQEHLAILMQALADHRHDYGEQLERAVRRLSDELTSDSIKDIGELFHRSAGEITGALRRSEHLEGKSILKQDEVLKALGGLTTQVTSLGDTTARLLAVAVELRDVGNGIASSLAAPSRVQAREPKHHLQVVPSRADILDTVREDLDNDDET